MKWIQQHRDEDASAGSWNEVKQDGWHKSNRAAPQRHLLDTSCQTATVGTFHNPSLTQTLLTLLPLKSVHIHSSGHIYANKWLVQGQMGPIISKMRAPFSCNSAASGDSSTLIPFIHKAVPLWAIGHSDGGLVTVHQVFMLHFHLCLCQPKAAMLSRIPPVWGTAGELKPSFGHQTLEPCVAQATPCSFTLWFFPPTHSSLFWGREREREELTWLAMNYSSCANLWISPPLCWSCAQRLKYKPQWEFLQN